MQQLKNINPCFLYVIKNI